MIPEDHYRLVEAGILNEVTGRERNRVYLASEILNVLEKELGEQG